VGATASWQVHSSCLVRLLLAHERTLPMATATKRAALLGPSSNRWKAKSVARGVPPQSCSRFSSGREVPYASNRRTSFCCRSCRCRNVRMWLSVGCRCADRELCNCSFRTCHRAIRMLSLSVTPTPNRRPLLLCKPSLATTTITSSWALLWRRALVFMRGNSIQATGLHWWVMRGVGYLSTTAR
jgi:hypothetical protein